MKRKLKIIISGMERKYLIFLIILVAVFFLTTLQSYYTPYSARAFVEYNLSPITSNLNGRVSNIFVSDNTIVNQGEPLFKVEVQEYEDDLNNLKAKYNEQIQVIESYNHQIQEEKEVLQKNINTSNKKKKDYLRYQSLYNKRLIAKSDYENYELDYLNSLKDIEQSKESIKSLEKQRGSSNYEENNSLLSIKADISTAKKNLSDTEIKASKDGIISIHQLFIGERVNSSSNYGYIYNKNDFTIKVDYMEKSLINLRPGEKSLVVFDSIPGRVFNGVIVKTTALMTSGYTSPTNLEDVEAPTRWIRPSGRVRVEIKVTDKIPENANISSGSNAAVVSIDKKHPVSSLLAIIWIRLSSLINYIY